MTRTPSKNNRRNMDSIAVAGRFAIHSLHQEQFQIVRRSQVVRHSSLAHGLFPEGETLQDLDVLEGAPDVAQQVGARRGVYFGGVRRKQGGRNAIEDFSQPESPVFGSRTM